MIEYVRIVNHLQESIKIVMKDDSPVHGLMIQKIDGLGGMQSTINTTDYAISDGSYLSSRRVGNRNVVIDFRLADSLSDDRATKNIENSRLRLYKYCQLKQLITVVIHTDSDGYNAETGLTVFKVGVEYYERDQAGKYTLTTDITPNQQKTYYTKVEKYIQGYVEKAEPDIFSEKEDVQVSIICIDPYFKIRKFEAIGSTMSIYYKGTAETGYIIRSRVEKVTDVSYITINGVKLNVETIQTIVGESFSTSGYIEIDSRVGSKSIKYVNGLTWNIMQAAGLIPIEWPTLKYGNNEMEVSYDSDEAPINTDTGWPEDSTEVFDPDMDDYKLVLEFDEAYGGI